MMSHWNHYHSPVSYMKCQNLELKYTSTRITVNLVLADPILSEHPELSGQECQWDKKVSFCNTLYDKPLLDGNLHKVNSIESCVSRLNTSFAVTQVV